MNEINEKPHYGKINPFTGIWVRTRETVRYVIEEKSFGYVMMLIVIAGIISSLVGAFDPEATAGFPIWGTLLMGIIIGPIAGIVGVAIISAIYLVIGKLFKGTSTYSEMFKAIGTTSIPSIWFAPILLVGYLAAPDLMAVDAEVEITPASMIIGGLMAIAGLVFTIWSILIQSKAIGEAHRFSSWKGFFTLLIPGVIGLVLLIALIIFLVATFMNFS
ncbi:Yip1 family protein [Planococcus shixiaomingii]|uniref:Yip1 family protein n=1 Tax=Planococcus shixiaomingii TaxID=3058393 RepID=UPI00262EF398|nr:Yip1 family protein [Planococcus sp. N022]WKA53040.1 Yip1 family protein [Planococcus sp. N022]